MSSSRRVALPELEVANAQFVTPRLAFGGDLAPGFGQARRQLDDLVGAGITHIVDLRDEWSDQSLVTGWAPGIAYLHHRVEDAGQRIPAEWFEGLLEWVEAAWQEPGSKVLVHCHMGVNRAPSAAFALLLAQGWPVRDALNALRRVRPIALIDYAADALDWHLARTGAGRYSRAGARRSLTMWRRANQLDTREVIRRIRAVESEPATWCISLDPSGVAELAEAVEGHRTPAVAFGVVREPGDLAMRDRMLLWALGPGGGIVGSGLVIGPPQPDGEGGAALPVALLAFDAEPLLRAELVSLVLPAGVPLPGGGGNPERLSEAQLTAISIAADLRTAQG
jgi:hypothetical protein